MQRGNREESVKMRRNVELENVCKGGVVYKGKGRE